MKNSLERVFDYLETVFAFVLVYGGLFALLYVLFYFLSPIVESYGYSDFLKRQPVAFMTLTLVVVVMALLLQFRNTLYEHSRLLEQILSRVTQIEDRMAPPDEK